MDHAVTVGTKHGEVLFGIAFYDSSPELVHRCQVMSLDVVPADGSVKSLHVDPASLTGVAMYSLRLLCQALISVQR